ncbi:HAMP domain-containing methyl-accepting chemotaxis protein [Marispirochaeta sp.]|uniref:methyl-accepting chemotaxis protein n=1 Tax=Marispirochaeta sp. TaxID=2038653 RepID=UPI0029C8D017|nr:HAMP domain-containing methyl-accepting chemotaxis protein [Marispirochaeta sp.]
MLIKKKLNLLNLLLIVGVVSGIVIFAIRLTPAVIMRSEKDTLMFLNSEISELRAEVNKLALSPLANQKMEIEERYNGLKEQFTLLGQVKALSTDDDILEAVETIQRLYALLNENYQTLMQRLERLSKDARDIYYTDNVKIETFRNSNFLKMSERAEEVTTEIDNLYSFIAIIDSNLSSTYQVVREQFEVINKLIEKRETFAYLYGAVVILIITIGTFTAVLLSTGKIASTIVKAARGIREMSSGDISKEFSVDSRDEIGELSGNLNFLIGNLKKVFESMKASSAEGVRLKEELIASTSQTSAAAQEISSNSGSIRKQVLQLSEQVAGAEEAAKVLKESLSALAGYIRSQTAMVEESTSSVTEMISSIKNIAGITEKKLQATNILVRTAENGGEKLNTTTTTIDAITENLDQIKGTATIIQQIASQTNLLAMNAAIESAHAGEAGRGFAVVADEIRKLAEASSANSKEISGVIKEVVSRIELASSAGEETQQAFSAINSEVSGVSLSLHEISNSMDELNTGGEQILEAMTGLQEVSSGVQQGSIRMNDAFDEVYLAIGSVDQVSTEVAGSVAEIDTGIREISSSMLMLSELAENLGEITDLLEKEAAQFTTESSEEVPDQDKQPVP